MLVRLSNDESAGCVLPEEQERAFTLIELLVVSALLAVLATILYSSLNGILQGRSIIDEQRDRGRAALFTIERMTRELTARVLTPLSSVENEGQSSGVSRGQSRRYLIGTNAKDTDVDEDTIRFVSSAGGQDLFSDYSTEGLVEISYQLLEYDEAPGVPEDEDLKERRGKVLVRTERPAAVQDEDLLRERSLRLPLAYEVASLNFRYLKDGNWVQEWREYSARPPEAIEVTLKLFSSEDSIETFRTAVALSKQPRQRRGGGASQFGTPQ